jgi:Bacterial membrane protein YfhO
MRLPRWRPRVGHARTTGDGVGRDSLYLLSLVLLGIFVIVALGPALLGRGTLLDVDQLTAYAPFTALHGLGLHDAITCRTDTINGVLPAMANVKHGLWRGDLSTWNPYNAGGAPLGALPNQAQLSPLTLPYYVLPLWLAPAFIKLGEIAVAVGGMVAFLRRHGLTRAAGVLAGIVFAASGYMMMWTNWPQTRVGAFIPLLFWALERLVQERRARDVVPAALVVACMLLGGFPSVTMYTLVVAGAYVLVRVVSTQRQDVRAAAGVLLRAAAGVVLGFGLSAVQLLPFIKNLSALRLDERVLHGDHLPLGLFLTTVDPDSAGLCVGGERYGSVIPIEGVAFLGVAAMVLALCALALPVPTGAARDRSPWLFFGVALVVVSILIWVGGPLLDAVEKLPFFASNRMSRAQSVFGFLGAVLAGVGFDRLGRWLGARRQTSGEPGPSRRSLWVSGLVLVAPVLVAGLVLFRARASAIEHDYAAHLLSSLWVPALFLLGALAAVAVVLLGPRRLRRPALGSLAVLAVAQSAMFAHTMLPVSERENMYPVTGTHRYLGQHLGGERFGSSGTTLYPATGTYYRLRTPVGHEFTAARWWDLLRAVDPRTAVTPTYSLFPSDLSAEESARMPLLDQLAVRYWVGRTSDVAGVTGPSRASRSTVALRPREVGHCEVNGGALRGVQLVVDRTRRTPEQRTAVVHVRVHTPDGAIEGARFFGGPIHRGNLRVAVAGEDVSGAGPYPVDVWFTGLKGGTRLAGGPQGLSCQAVRPTDDGLRLVFSEAGDTVYERKSALPRVRWAAHSRVVPDGATRVRELTDGIPGDEVLLDDDSTPAAAGRPADVRVTSDQPERLAARVDAEGAGYLMVADSIARQGWTATVDGRSAHIVPANHAFAAVPVPEGRHTVVLSYTAPGLRAGAVVSAVSVVVVVILLAWPWWSRRRRVPGDATHPGLP